MLENPFFDTLIVLAIFLVLSSLFVGVAKRCLVILAFLGSFWKFLAQVWWYASRACMHTIPSILRRAKQKDEKNVPAVINSKPLQQARTMQSNQNDVDEEAWPGVKVILWDLGLIVGLCLLLGDLPLFQSKNSVLLKIAITNLHIPIDLFNSLLWILVPGVFFGFLAELRKWSYHDGWVLPLINERDRKVLSIVTLVMLVLSIAAVFLFAYITQQPISTPDLSLLTRHSTSQLPLIVVGMFAVLLVSASLLALGMVAQGVQGLIATVVLLCSCIFLVLWLPCAIFTKVFEGLGLVFAYFSPKPIVLHPRPPMPDFDTIWRRLRLPGSRRSLSGGIDEDEDDEYNLQIELEGDPVMTLKKCFMLVLDDDGLRLAKFMLEDLRMRKQLGLLIGGSVINLVEHTIEQVLFRKFKVDDSSTLPLRNAEALTQAHQNTIVAYGELISSVLDLLKTKIEELECHQGEIIILGSFTLFSQLERVFTELRTRFPQFTLIPLCPMPITQGEEAVEALQRIMGMHQRKLFPVVLTYDRFGPYRKLAKQTGMERSVVSAVLNLVDTHRLVGDKPAVRILEFLGAQSAIASLSLAERNVAWGRQHVLYRGARFLVRKLPVRGYGSPVDAIHQGGEVLDDLKKYEHRAIPVRNIDVADYAAVVLAIPFPHYDEKEFGYVSGILRRELDDKFHKFESVFVTGGNVPVSEGRPRTQYCDFGAAFFPLSQQVVIEQLVLPGRVAEALPAPDNVLSAPALPQPVSQQSSLATVPLAQEDDGSHSNQQNGAQDKGSSDQAKRGKGRPRKTVKPEEQE